MVGTAARVRFEEMRRKSLAYQFNETLDLFEPPLDKISHDTVQRWLKMYFPRHGVSPVPSDYCDTCAELKQQINSSRRVKQHLVDNGNASESDIAAKEKLTDSYRSALHRHRQLATAEQAEYKTRIAKTTHFFTERIRNPVSQLAAADALSNDENSEVVLACDFQMGNILPH